MSKTIEISRELSDELAALFAKGFLDDSMVEAIVAVARKHAAPVAVAPEGWKLVPIEPTELMVRRGDQNYSWSVAKIYKAMIDAAPVTE
jgi:hypothetical protein